MCERVRERESLRSISFASSVPWSGAILPDFVFCDFLSFFERSLSHSHKGKEEEVEGGREGAEKEGEREGEGEGAGEIEEEVREGEREREGEGEGEREGEREGEEGKEGEGEGERGEERGRSVRSRLFDFESYLLHYCNADVIANYMILLNGNLSLSLSLLLSHTLTHSYSTTDMQRRPFVRGDISLILIISLHFLSKYNPYCLPPSPPPSSSPSLQTTDPTHLSATLLSHASSHGSSLRSFPLCECERVRKEECERGERS